MEDKDKTKEQLIKELVEMRQHNAELKASGPKVTKDVLKALADNSTIGLYIVQDGKFRFANHKFQDLVGYSEEELVNMDSLSLVSPEDRDMVRENAVKILKGECFSPYEFRYINKDGESLWVMETVISVQYQGKRAALGNFMDITDRKRAETILRGSEEKLRLIFESVPEGIINLDFEGKILDINESVVNMHGYDTKEELIGRNAAELIVDRDRANIMKDIRRLLEVGFIEPSRYMLVRKDGSEFQCAVISSVLRDTVGKPTGFLAIAMDITEQQKMQEQLLITDRLASIGQLAAGIAHELNNPLTSVIGFSELLLEKDFPKEVREDLETISKDARRAANVVKGLLTFVRKQGTEKSSEDINSIIQEVLQLRSYEQRVSNIDVDVRFTPDLPNVIVNGAQMQQVFMNLIVNAEQAMLGASKEGRLRVKTEEVGDSIKISIVDDGPGISPENMKKLFSPFFTTKGVGKGTGLGLSICQGIVTEHGGRIYAESEPGKGASFILELPISTGGGKLN